MKVVVLVTTSKSEIDNSRKEGENVEHGGSYWAGPVLSDRIFTLRWLRSCKLQV